MGERENVKTGQIEENDIDVSEMPKEITEQNLHRHAKLLLRYALDALEPGKPKQVTDRILAGMIRRHLGMKPVFIK